MYFWKNHFTFYISYWGMNYCNVIGFLLFLSFGVQFLSGLLLSFYYSTFSSFSFDSVNYIVVNVNIGWFIRFFHVFGSSLFMFFLFLHFLRGSYLKLKVIDTNFRLIRITGWFLFLCSLLEVFIGYISIWGQMSYRGITVIINIVSIIPYFGNILFSLIWCNSTIILNRIFIIHFLFGFILTIFLILHIFFLHSFSSSNPLLNSTSSFVIPFFPFLFKDFYSSFLILCGLISFLLFRSPDILGHADNQIIANPLKTPIHILPEWYFLFFHCCLRAFPSKIVGVIIVFNIIILCFWYY